AEDGIRDWSVTGVQTCALPIWRAVGVQDVPDPFFKLKLRSDDARLVDPDAPVLAGRLDDHREGPPPPRGRELVHDMVIRGWEPEIGRASCRERVWIAVVSVS